MNRDKQIDLLKIIAAMAVILLHYYNGNIGGQCCMLNNIASICII